MRANATVRSSRRSVGFTRVSTQVTGAGRERPDPDGQEPTVAEVARGRTYPRTGSTYDDELQPPAGPARAGRASRAAPRWACAPATRHLPARPVRRRRRP